MYHSHSTIKGYGQQDIRVEDSGFNRRTIHNEYNGMAVSSDDSSDDDDVISRTSRASKMTIHNEANGIWVSSDDESECSQPVVAHRRRPRQPIPSSLIVRNNVFKSTIDPASTSNNLPSNTWDSHTSWSTSSNTTARTHASISSYMSSSGSEIAPKRIARRRSKQRPRFIPPTPITPRPIDQIASPAVARQLRRRRFAAKELSGYGSSAYDSFETVSLTTDHGYTSASSYGSPSLQQRPRFDRSRSAGFQPSFTSGTDTHHFESSAQQNETFVAPSHYTIHDRSNQAAVDETQLHAEHFWDQDGRKACYAERGLQGIGAASSMFALASGYYLGFFVVLVFTTFAASYFSTIYRILSWRKKSGIEIPALFNDLYELAEQVATDTRITMPSGEMRQRKVCAGEIGASLSRHARMIDTPTKLCFWIEACVHFRLTIRNGCHHLGGGKLPAKSLTTAGLAMFSKKMPTDICACCDNKIEIERRFPLKCD